MGVVIPKNDGLSLDIKIVERPSKTYKMDLDNNIIVGIEKVELKAMEQAIYKILRTERYKYIIYSWDYGIELNDLFGMPVSFCVPEIERRIVEALLQDTRIVEVDEFTFNTEKKGVVLVQFTAHTIFGKLQIGEEVGIA